jgi:ABC-type multidrug transport system fused ATPase/permease subunit
MGINIFIFLGRILNRFSKDQNAIDESLSQSMLTMLNQTFLTIGVFITIAFVSPLFISLLLPIGLCSPFYWSVLVLVLHCYDKFATIFATIFYHFFATIFCPNLSNFGSYFGPNFLPKFFPEFCHFFPQFPYISPQFLALILA